MKRKWLPLALSECLFGAETISGKLASCYEAGFAAFEFSPVYDAERLNAHVKEIQRELETTELKIWSVHLPFGAQNDISAGKEAERQRVENDLKAYIDVVKELHPAVAVVHGSAEPIKEEERLHRMEQSIRSLATLTEYCRQYGIQLAVECLPRTCLGRNSEEILTMTDTVEGLAVCFDTNHLTLQQPLDFVQKVGSKIVTTHVSDYDFIDERHWMPGWGKMDWSALYQALIQAGYDGPILFEVVNRPENPRLTPKMLAQNWRNLLAQP